MQVYILLTMVPSYAIYIQYDLNIHHVNLNHQKDLEKYFYSSHFEGVWIKLQYPISISIN